MTEIYSKGLIEALVQLVEDGPTWDGDVVNKTYRNELIKREYAVRIIVKGEEGYTAANCAGRDLYKKIFCELDGTPAPTMKEAKVNRLAKKFIRRISSGN